MFDILSVEDVEWLIKLYIALGKSLATIYDVSGSVQAYHAALKVCFYAFSFFHIILQRSLMCTCLGVKRI
jgi:hypothetical protein